MTLHVLMHIMFINQCNSDKYTFKSIVVFKCLPGALLFKRLEGTIRVFFLESITYHLSDAMRLISCSGEICFPTMIDFRSLSRSFFKSLD